MTTDQMKYFLKAAKMLNFTAAAERLFITQPALSQQITAIEKELNMQLFVRGNNSVYLTPAGELFYKRLQDIYQNYLYLIEQISDLNASNSGHLNIGLLEDQLLDEVIIDSINYLVKQYPNINVGVSKRDAYALCGGLADGTLDIAVMLLYDGAPTSGMRTLPICSGPLYLAISKKHSAARLDIIDFGEIAKITEKIPLMIASLENFSPPLRTLLDRHAEDVRAEMGCKIQYHAVPSVSSLSLYTTAGLGVAMVNEGNALSIDPNVKLILVKDGDILTKGLVWKANNANPIAQLMTEYIQDKLKTTS